MCLPISSALLGGYVRLLEHHTNGSVKKRNQTCCYRLHCSGHFKKLNWKHSVTYKKMVEEFPVSLALSDRMIPLEVFDQTFLVKYPSRER
jgi:hypothetical protein